MKIYASKNWEGLIREPKVSCSVLIDDGTFPNNDRLPLLVYAQAVASEAPNLTAQARDLLAVNHWGGAWVNGLYAYHHYHSTAHEVLVVCAGRAELQLGGPQGLRVQAQAGDMIVIPAGVAHKNLESSDVFSVLGAYPQGQVPDLCVGRQGERPGTDEAIAVLQVPICDPLYGRQGPLVEHWIPGLV